MQTAIPCLFMRIEKKVNDVGIDYPSNLATVLTKLTMPAHRVVSLAQPQHGGAEIKPGDGLPVTVCFVLSHV